MPGARAWYARLDAAVTLMVHPSFRVSSLCGSRGMTLVNETPETQRSAALAGFRLGEPAAPVLAAANQCQRGQHQQAGTDDEQRERNRPLKEYRPVPVRHDQGLAQAHFERRRDDDPEHQGGRVEAELAHA